MRQGEQYGLRWEDVDWERRQLTIPRSKNGAMRHLHLNATALHALAEMRAQTATQTWCVVARKLQGADLSAL